MLCLHVLKQFGAKPLAPENTFKFEIDILEEIHGYSDMIQRVREAVKLAFPQSTSLSTTQRVTLRLLRWVCDRSTMEKNLFNECIVSKLVNGDEIRAHADGIYVHVATLCVWCRQSKFSFRQVRHITNVFSLAKSLVAALANANGGGQWQDRGSFLTTIAMTISARWGHREVKVLEVKILTMPSRRPGTVDTRLYRDTATI